MTSKIEYCTCEHLKRDAVRGACKVVTTFHAGSLGGPDEGQWLACTRCDLRGSRNDPFYMDHFISDRHFVGVRLHEPREMYCVACGDYQYHSDFDRRLGLRRLQRWGAGATTEAPKLAAATPPDKPAAGFVNMGNTCFLSSVMQVLLHNAALLRYYGAGAAKHVGQPADGSACIACSVQDIYTERGGPSSLTPSGLLHAMWAQFGHMAAYEQQDAHEFLVALLDGLSTHLHRHHSADCSVLQHFVLPPEAPPLRAEVDLDVARVSSYYSTGHFKFHGIVNEVFSGVLRSDLACAACLHRSFKFEPFRDISLSIRQGVSRPAAVLASVPNGDSQSPKRRRLHDVGAGVLLLPTEDDDLDIKDVPELPDELFLADGDDTSLDHVPGSLTLQDCLKQFTAAETLAENRYCDHCQAEGPVTKQMSFFTPPNVLIIHLKRFDAFGHNKIRTHVSMPLAGMDLRDYFCMSIDRTAEEAAGQCPGSSMTFDLHGVVCHSGDSLSQGHYVCYVLTGSDEAWSDSNQWMRCDDEKTTMVSAQEVEASEGYILFYVNRSTKELLQNSPKSVVIN